METPVPVATLPRPEGSEALPATETECKPMHVHGIERPPVGEQVATLLAVGLPPIGLLAAILLLWGPGVNWESIIIMAVGYLLTAIGVTVGYHRLFTHKSFECPAFIRLGLGILGSMAAEGPVIRWAAMHRRHHQFSDHDGDPHSPHAFKAPTHHRHAPDKDEGPHEECHHAGPVAVLKGFWHSHMGWFFRALPKDIERYCPDLKADRATSFVDKTFWVWILASAIIPAIVGGLWMQSWTGALLGLIWGGMVRLLLVHHVTWSVNSVCHLWGSRPYDSHDHSRNNPIMGILAMGEGWHNNHHAFPTSARHGLHWWQIDLSYVFIRVLSMMGLAKNVKVPAAARLEARVRKVA